MWFKLMEFSGLFFCVCVYWKILHRMLLVSVKSIIIDFNICFQLAFHLKRMLNISDMDVTNVLAQV